jgi:hypothetical protein
MPYEGFTPDTEWLWLSTDGAIAKNGNTGWSRWIEIVRGSQIFSEATSAGAATLKIEVQISFANKVDGNKTSPEDYAAVIEVATGVAKAKTITAAATEMDAPHCQARFRVTEENVAAVTAMNFGVCTHIAG